MKTSMIDSSSIPGVYRTEVTRNNIEGAQQRILQLAHEVERLKKKNDDLAKENENIKTGNTLPTQESFISPQKYPFGPYNPPTSARKTSNDTIDKVALLLQDHGKLRRMLEDIYDSYQ